MTDPSASTGTSGDLTFTSTGQLDATASATSVGFAVGPLQSGAPALALTWNLLNKDLSPRLTQVAETSGVAASTQNGSPAAQLMKVGLADGGLIVAQFSDDQQTVVGQLAMASIRNPDTLAAQGNNNFGISANTSSPVIGLPGSGGRGQIVGASIEASTVDIATEFTNLIVYQRAYQANSKVVTTVDQLSQDTINLIR
jgi:flagellar hook protein FlgE